MLDGIRVVDLADERGLVCGWMLAELGADVVAVEPPGGSPARRQGPFVGNDPGPERSLQWWAHARNKRSAVLDDEAIRALAARADVLIETQAPGVLAGRGLGYDALAEQNPRLVYVSITPFGQDGPKAGWAASDLTLVAAGGPLWLMGDDDRAPVRVSVPQAFQHAGAEAAAATLIALHERHRSGRGQRVDVSAQQAVTIATQSDIVSALVGEPAMSRFGGGAKLGPLTLRLVYPAADGHVSITHVFGSAIGPVTARMMQRVCEDGFCDEEMRDKDWVGFLERLAAGQESFETFEAAKQAVGAWTSSKTKAELLQIAMDRGLLIAPCTTPADVVESPQLAARGYFERAPRPDGKGQALQLGRFARFSGWTPSAIRPAPRIGEHTEEVVAELAAPAPAPARPRPTSESTTLPLEGLKVLDFMWAIAGPMATRILADHGATVIRVESSTRFDACRTMRPFVDAQPHPDRSALFHTCNAGKRMLTLDLGKPEARAVIHDLVRWADVVCESFSPGTMKKLGYDYESLRELKPEIVMLSTCLMGQTGPLATFAGYGNLAAAIAGFFDLTGWPDRDPAGPFGAYTDYIAPRFNVSSILAALEHRRRTGQGQHIDLSQAEAALHFLAPALLEYTVDGRVPTRVGNRDRLYAPHGCYPCAGEDRWLAIAVEGDEQFAALCAVLGSDALASDARFASIAARRANAEGLDEALAERTVELDAGALESRLQSAGVAAHVVLDSHGLAADPQLNARQHFVRLDGDPPTTVEGSRSRLSRTPAEVRLGTPTMGRDSHAILEEILGYDDERITELAIAGVLE